MLSVVHCLKMLSLFSQFLKLLCRGLKSALLWTTENFNAVSFPCTVTQIIDLFAILFILSTHSSPIPSSDFHSSKLSQLRECYWFHVILLWLFSSVHSRHHQCSLQTKWECGTVHPASASFCMPRSRNVALFMMHLLTFYIYSFFRSFESVFAPMKWECGSVYHVSARSCTPRRGTVAQFTTRLAGPGSWVRLASAPCDRSACLSNTTCRHTNTSYIVHSQGHSERTWKM